VFYRDNCADIELTIDDVLALPLDDVGVFQFAGTNLSREPSRSATLFAAERARDAGERVVIDIDFRTDQWHDRRAFGAAVCSVLRLADVALGTVDEINAAVLADPADVRLEHSHMSDAQVGGDVEPAARRLLSLGPEVVVEKPGARGARVW
jgi:5-dehydro-2-deoxygluconokinase